MELKEITKYKLDFSEEEYSSLWITTDLLSYLTDVIDCKNGYIDVQYPDVKDNIGRVQWEQLRTALYVLHSLRFGGKLEAFGMSPKEEDGYHIKKD